MCKINIIKFKLLCEDYFIFEIKCEIIRPIKNIYQLLYLFKKN